MDILKLPYRMAIFFTVILASVFIVVISVNQHYVEVGFKHEADKRFAQADAIIRQYMNKRYDRIYANALLLSEDPRVVELLGASEISYGVRNQTLEGKILSRFIDANLVVLFDQSGKIIANTKHPNGLTDVLKTMALVSQVQEEGIGKRNYIKWQGLFFQNVVLPIYVEDQVVGSVLSSVMLSQAEINEIKKISGVELMIMEDTAIVLMTNWPAFIPFSNWLMRQSIEDMVDQEPKEVHLSNAKAAIYHHRDFNDNFVPPYLKVFPLDGRDVIVAQVKKITLILAALGVLLSFIAAFFTKQMLKNTGHKRSK